MVDRDGEKCYAYESDDGNSLFAFYCYAAHGYICQRAGNKLICHLSMPVH